jgi:hypothetical protein
MFGQGVADHDRKLYPGPAPKATVPLKTNTAFAFISEQDHDR